MLKKCLFGKTNKLEKIREIRNADTSHFRAHYENTPIQIY